MGVPKFYRWISERYPCLSQVVKDYQVPEFDNFYLDMNGIIHACSHPNDDDPTFRISEDKIFNDIFRYIEAMFRIIKPQKVMFLAVDGVAPRAKMNQQRGRRFRSAREAQDLVRKALLRGELMPSEPRFDSNCITPGTDFMARLHEHLKYFINKKLSSDPTWQKVEIILSGHDVPGEGEHKIMDYIRYRKAQPDYDSNTRHCLYGLDADLIMLGLLSHEPHFSLLREEVRFGKKSQKRQTTPDTITFHLLHLSIMREYLDFEFASLKDKLSFGYDLERIIDDWVLMGFLVGNDFLPHLPNMHIRQDALPLLYSKYMEVLPTLDGYINEGGTLHMGRFEAYLRALADFDYSFHEELQGGMKWLASKRQQGRERAGKAKKQRHGGGSGEESSSPEENGTTSTSETDLLSSEDAGVFPTGLADFMSSDVGGASEEFDESSEAAVKLKRDLKIDSLQSFFDKEDETTQDNFESDFFEHKATYYQSKLGIDHVDEAALLEQAKCYVVGIQWVLHYYYSGVPSWSWFYPYHYAPYVSDIKGFSDIQIDFQVGHPFFPFEQLLAVLPPASKSLLPKPYQALMINEDSPVKDFYPLEFETDLNGKQMEWEAVVLIPFIDEGRLLEAMKPCSIYLNEEEVRRNGFGNCLVYGYDPKAEKTVYPSPWAQFFKDITNCQVSLVQLSHFPFPVESDRLVRGLCEGVKLDVHFPGFPSLKHVPHTGHLEKRGVRVFQSASRGENLVLAIPPKELPKNLLTLAEELIGQIVYVGWPYLTEAMVHSLSNGTVQYYESNHDGGKRHHKSRLHIESSELSPSELKQWREEESLITRQYLDRRGIDIGQVELIVYAQTLQGKRYVVDKRKEKGSVCLDKEWATIAEPFPYQTIVRDITAFAPEFREKVTTLQELFPPKSHCFILATPHYGCLAEVVSVEMPQLRVVVKVPVHPEPDMDSVINNHRLSVRYLPSFVVSDRVGLPALVLSRITSNIQVEKGSRENKKEREKVKIGLSWKFSRRNQEILGYARKTEKGWSFSPDAVNILQEFKQKFPKMFEYLVKNATEDSYYEQDLFPSDGAERLSDVKDWLKQLPSQGLEAVDCGSYTLDPPQIAAVEKAVLDVQRRTSTKPLRTVKLKVKPGCLFKPVDHQGNLIPDPEAEYYLFDRVINVSTTNAVPFGLRGTVMGIYGDGSNELLYEILFDEEFLGGLALRCSQNRAYRLPPSCLLNISHGKRLEEEKKAQKLTGHSPRSDFTRTDFSYASATSKPHPQSSDSGPTPHGHAFFRSRFRFSNTASSGVYDQPQQSPRQQGYDAVDSYSHYYDHRHGNQHSGSAHHTYGQRSMELVTESSRGVSRSSRGRERSGRSPDSRGRTQHREATREKKQPFSDKQTPVIMQRGGGADAMGGARSSAGQQSSRHTQNVDKKKSTKTEDDDFSAALQALPKMKPSTGNSAKAQTGRNDSKAKEKQDAKKSPQSVKSDRGGKKEREKQPSPKRDKKRDLSPSVAAIFDAVSSGQASSSDVISDDTDTQEEQEAGPSATLKSMLNIHSVAPPLQAANQHIPPALQKLLRAPAPATAGPQHPPGAVGFPPQPPRVPLLPYPGYQQHPPPQMPLGGIPPQMRYPMPFGPPAAVNHVAQLHQVAQSAGHPKPEITIDNTPQGCIGIVSVGTFKYKGLPCPNPEDAKQSAAAIAISNLPGAKMPLLPYPMYPPGPYSYPMMPPYPPMFPPPPGRFNAPPTGPQHYPPGPRSSTPPHSTRFNRPSFVPLQVQRRQVHKTTKETESTKSTKPSSDDTTRKASKKEKEEATSQEELTAVEDKMEHLSLEGVAMKRSSSRVSTDGELEPSTPEKGREPKNGDSHDTNTTADVDVNATDKKQESAGSKGEAIGAESEDEDGEAGATDGEEPEVKGGKTEEQILKHLERVQQDSEETKEKLKKLTGYVRALDTAPREIPPEDEGTSPHSESRTHDADTSEIVTDMDPVAQAAILASLQDREMGAGSLEDEGEMMEPVQASETDPNNIVIVGEIMGPRIPGAPDKAEEKEEETHKAIEATILKLEEDRSGESVPQAKSIVEEVIGGATLGTEHAQEAADGESDVRSTTGSHDLAASSHTPSKKPKRLLAASFMNT